MQRLLRKGHQLGMFCLAAKSAKSVNCLWTLETRPGCSDLRAANTLMLVPTMPAQSEDAHVTCLMCVSTTPGAI